MRTKCPVCGKKFDILYSHLWAYNIDRKQFFCSWKCIQKYRQQKEEIKLGKITLEQKKKVIQIALGGGDPVAYLEECGSEKPTVSWNNILRNLETKDPEVYELLTRKVKKPKVDKSMPKKLELEAGENYEISAKEAMDNAKAVTDVFFGKCEEAGLKIGKITAPLIHSGKTAIGWAGDFGEYYYDRKQGYIDYESNDGEELSMPVEAWRNWLEEIHEVAQLMGVEL